MYTFPEKCSQRILLFMWLLKCALLCHRRFLSVVINALFWHQMLQRRQLHSLPLKLQSPTSSLKSNVCPSAGRIVCHSVRISYKCQPCRTCKHNLTYSLDYIYIYIYILMVLLIGRVGKAWFSLK